MMQQGLGKRTGKGTSRLPCFQDLHSGGLVGKNEPLTAPPRPALQHKVLRKTHECINAHVAHFQI